MRKLPLLLLSLCAIAPALAAQQFEGTLKVRVAGFGGTGAMMMTMTAKGDKVLNVMTLPGINQEARSITDNKARTMTTYTPFPPGMTMPSGVANAKGIMMVQKFPEIPTGAKPGKSDVRPTGTSQTIAGYKCDDFEVTGETGEVIRMCLSTSLGGFMAGSLGNGGPGGRPAPWAKALGNRPAAPLKIWQPNGTTILEVVEVKRHPVPLSTFDAPSGYVDAATAMKARTSVPPRKP